MGRVLADGLRAIAGRHAAVGEARSVGLLGAIELADDRGAPAPAILERLLPAVWGEGVLAIPGGVHANVLSILPPLTITEEQLRCALGGIDRALERAGGRYKP
jgi:4-aminobutyrate aminotransferase-like enzyme